jgi:hypothetical protein
MPMSRRLPFHVQSLTVHRGYVFPSVFPCDCGGIGCEAFLDDIAEQVLGGQQIGASAPWYVSDARGVAVEWIEVS